MSYILDALKRADAERERSHVPGLHSQSMPATRPTRRQATAFRLQSWHGTALAGLVLIAATAWWWSQAAPVAALPTPAVESPPAQPPPIPSDQPDQHPRTPEPALPILAPQPPQTVPTRPTSQKATAAAASPGAAKAAPAPARGFAELSPEARAQLPAVNISGSTYSQNPAHRMLIANGKVVQEGQEIAPGLQLESIGPRSAVLNHQGMRYSIGY